MRAAARCSCSSASGATRSRCCSSTGPDCACSTSGWTAGHSGFRSRRSARLHGLDPEAYLRDLIRVLPYWPRDRYLDLCPRDWLATRVGLDAAELDAELGPITLPPSPEQPAAR